jgi:hypothetical protein
MANQSLTTARQTANPTAFRKALAAFEAADRIVELRPTRTNKAIYSRRLRRLLAIPSPDVAGLAAKLAVANPFDLDEYYDLVADARRLAGL